MTDALADIPTLPGILPPEPDERRSAALPRGEAVVVVVPGKPKPWRRSGFNPATRSRYVTREDHADRELVGRSWLTQTGARSFEREPVELRVEFVFDRPATHYGTGRNASLVKASAPRYPGKNLGDLDNLAKMVKDALTSVAFHDDSQVVTITASKRWAAAGERSRTVIELAAA